MSETQPVNPVHRFASRMGLRLVFLFVPLLGTTFASAASQQPEFIPEAAWSRPIGLPFTDPPVPHVMYPMLNDGPFNGAPLGGMGAGSIGRTYRGDFSRWHLDVGHHLDRTLPANMFSVFVQQGDRKMAQALYTGAPDDGTLSAWQWNYPVGAGTYYALYPRSWFDYDWDQLPVKLSVEQFSPVIPNNYQESSYPVALFNWTATNPGDQPVTVGIMFTWENLLDGTYGIKPLAGQVNKARTAEIDGQTVGGVQLEHDGLPAGEWNGTMALAALETPGVKVSYRSRFVASGNGAEIWTDFANDGALDNIDDKTPSTDEALGAGVTVTFTLQPGQTLTVPFALAWDMPVMSFGSESANKNTSWYKRYTAFYGHEGTHAFEMARDALENDHSWRQQIIDWQAPVLNDPARPTWYKTALFNELYFLADGGTAWEHGRVGQPEPTSDDIGNFAYMESYDYPYYATFDVDFYGSFALMTLFPELEKRLISDYAATIPDQDTRRQLITGTFQMVPRKLAGAVPHDLGGPNESPWLQPNNYNYRDVNHWKDLNAKFVLRLDRDAVLLHDPSLITDHWAAVQQALSYLQALDADGDGIPENNGTPDQTYDTWPATGVSAYSGSLWLGALAAAHSMAQTVGDSAAADRYQMTLQRATKVYEHTLWNGTYYDYDAGSEPYHDDIMSDQLAGQWYADFLGLSLLPDAHVNTALETIYQHNVQLFGDGQMGAVNGMRPNGQIDTSNEQSQEMWTGTTYGLASFMLMRGLDAEAWDTAYGVYRLTYETQGMWFRTPEAFDVNGNYRASIYERPLSIWAMETALEQRQSASSP